MVVARLTLAPSHSITLSNSKYALLPVILPVALLVATNLNCCQTCDGSLLDGTAVTTMSVRSKVASQSNQSLRVSNE
jgi:hypothetical protein